MSDHTDQSETQAGFSIVETLLILVVVGILGFTGWYVYHARQASDNDYSAAASTTVPTYKKKTGTKATIAKTADPYAGWNTYCSTTGGMCFQYPTTWTETEASQADGGTVTLTSPSKILEVSYTPNLQGIGGGPCACSFDEESVTPLASSNNSGLEVIKGIFSNTPASAIIPEYFLVSQDKMAPYNLKLNQTVNFNAFWAPLMTSPVNSSEIEEFAVRSLSTQNFTLSSGAAANAWLAQPEVATAGRILNSAYIKL